jgi:protein-disulfide isomerase
MAQQTKGSERRVKGKYVFAAAVGILIIVLAAGYVVRLSLSGNVVNNGSYTLRGTEPILGNANAKVTIIEFSDFECPYCGLFATNTFPLIKQNYVDTGKAKIVFVNYIVHPDAKVAAEAAYCANEQGSASYWAFNEKLFQNQGALDSASLKTYASGLGLDAASFNSCLDSGRFGALVDADTKAGAAAGIQGTPSFLINGVKVVGAQPYSVFQQTIDAALNA